MISHLEEPLGPPRYRNANLSPALQSRPVGWQAARPIVHYGLPPAAPASAATPLLSPALLRMQRIASAPANGFFGALQNRLATAVLRKNGVPGYAKGGRWDANLGRPVVVGEPDYLAPQAEAAAADLWRKATALPGPMQIQLPQIEQPREDTGAQELGAILGGLAAKKLTADEPEEPEELQLNRPAMPLEPPAGYEPRIEAPEMPMPELEPPRLYGRPRRISGYRRGGRWDEDLGRPVLTGEARPELVVADDGTVEVVGLDGPQVVVPQKPAVVVPLARPLPLPAEPAAVTPIAPELEEMEAGLPVESGSAPFRRLPKMSTASDAGGNLDLHERNLGEYGQQPIRDRDGRLKSFGKMFLRGLGTWQGQGGLAGLLGAGLGGGTVGLIRPSANERVEYGEEMARTQGLRQQQAAEEERALKRARAVADLQHTVAQTDVLRRPKAAQPDFERVEGADGIYVYDKSNPQAPPMKLPIPPKRGAEGRVELKEAGGKWWKVRPDGTTEPFVVDGQQVVDVKEGADKVDVTLPDGRRVRVPASTAYSAQMAADERQYRRGRDAQKDAEAVSEKESARAEAQSEAQQLEAMAAELEKELTGEVANYATGEAWGAAAGTVAGKPEGSLPSEEDVKATHARIADLRRRALELRERAVKPRARAQAAPTRVTSPARPKPKADPLGLFR